MGHKSEPEYRHDAASNVLSTRGKEIGELSTDGGCGPPPGGAVVRDEQVATSRCQGET